MENNVTQWDMSNNDEKNDSKKYVMKGYWESEIYGMAVNGMYGILITEKGSDVSAILHMNYDKYCSYRPGDEMKIEMKGKITSDGGYDLKQTRPEFGQQIDATVTVANGVYSGTIISRDPSDVVKVESSSRRSVNDKYTERSLKRELRSASSRTGCTIF